MIFISVGVIVGVIIGCNVTEVQIGQDIRPSGAWSRPVRAQKAGQGSGGGAPEGGHIFRRNLTKVRPDPPTPSSDGPLVGPDRWGRPGRAFSTFGGRSRDEKKIISKEAIFAICVPGPF